MLSAYQKWCFCDNLFVFFLKLLNEKVECPLVKIAHPLELLVEHPLQIFMEFLVEQPFQIFPWNF